jgi:hypothetical protein
MYRGKMNLRSTAVLFRNFGRIEGVLASLKCRVEYLKPDWWQKALRLGKSADHGDRLTRVFCLPGDSVGRGGTAHILGVYSILTQMASPDGTRPVGERFALR